MVMKNSIEWKENLTSEEWNKALTSLGGHPLQSANWGNSRCHIDHIKDKRWIAYSNGRPVYLSRFEERCLFKHIKIAWIPKGPTVSSDVNGELLQKEFFQRLKKSGYCLCVTNPWRKKSVADNGASLYTIWLDLSVGKEQLFKNLDKQFRYDVRRAEKDNVVVEQVNNKNDVEAFYQLCNSISLKKGFQLKTSAALMLCLLHENSLADVDSRLFVVKQDNKICAGAFILRCGENIHYLWGGVDRTYAKLRASEAIQWQVIEWALGQNCKQYDLEGIDLKNNPGTYHFKKKMGGTIIALPKERIFILHPLLKPFSVLLQIYSNLNLFLQKIIHLKYILFGRKAEESTQK